MGDFQIGASGAKLVFGSIQGCSSCASFRNCSEIVRIYSELFQMSFGRCRGFLGLLASFSQSRGGALIINAPRSFNVALSPPDLCTTGEVVIKGHGVLAKAQ